MLTYNLEQCAQALNIHSNTVLEFAHTGELRGARIGRAWVFLEEDILSFIKAQIETQTSARRKLAQKNEVNGHKSKLSTELDISTNQIPSRRGPKRKPLPDLSLLQPSPQVPRQV